MGTASPLFPGWYHEEAPFKWRNEKKLNNDRTYFSVFLVERGTHNLEQQTVDRTKVQEAKKNQKVL